MSARRMSGANRPTAAAILVRRLGVRAPYRTVARVDANDVRVLTCGHEKTGRDRRNGRYPCYNCQADKATKLAGGGT